jgi:hypothetical protein
MSEQDHDEIRRALKDIFPPVHPELRRDLWPLMLRRFDARKKPVGWFDWALVGLIGGVVMMFPDLILVLVYHF